VHVASGWAELSTVAAAAAAGAAAHPSGDDLFFADWLRRNGVLLHGGCRVVEDCAPAFEPCQLSVFLSEGSDSETANQCHEAAVMEEEAAEAKAAVAVSMVSEEGQEQAQAEIAGGLVLLQVPRQLWLHAGGPHLPSPHVEELLQQLLLHGAVAEMTVLALRLFLLTHSDQCGHASDGSATRATTDTLPLRALDVAGVSDWLRAPLRRLEEFVPAFVDVGVDGEALAVRWYSCARVGEAARRRRLACWVGKRA
jgi:hypothetical protein